MSHYDAGAQAYERIREIDATTTPGPPTPPALTAAEYDEIVGAIGQGLDDDPRRFNDLLSDACGFIGTLAIRRDVDPRLSRLAAECLRGMQLRATAGPNHEQEDHR